MLTTAPTLTLPTEDEDFELNMRQRRWLVLVKDYDCEILYHPGKANRVADALSRKTSATDINSLELELIDGQLSGRICIPNDEELRNQLLTEAYTTPYSVHLGATKMYKDMKKSFWWSGLKKDVANFPIEIPEWKWEQISMDFVVGLPKTTNGYDAVWVIVDRLTKSAHFLPIKITYSLEQLADLTAFHPQTDGQTERTIQILEDMLRASPMKGVMHFGKKGKLSPRYIGPFEILERVGKVAYKLSLPSELAAVHNVFHVSMLRKYVSDPSHVLVSEPIEVREDLTYQEQPVQILDRKDKALHNKVILLVKSTMAQP
ncbi:hypothetical protein UlMin_004942 [Ulmus minor]